VSEQLSGQEPVVQQPVRRVAWWSPAGQLHAQLPPPPPPPPPPETSGASAHALVEFPQYVLFGQHTDRLLGQHLVDPQATGKVSGQCVPVGGGASSSSTTSHLSPHGSASVVPGGQ
jgi:hypothetical protein